MPYVDPNTIHNPATAGIAPATWGDQIRDNGEFLIDPPACSVFHSAVSAAMNSNTLTILSADSENFDNDAMHSTVTNNSRITIKTAGRYTVGAVVNWTAEAITSNAHLLQFLVNGSTIFNIVQLPSVNHASFSTAMSGERTLTLALNDFVEVRVRHQNNTTKTVQLEEFYALFLTR